MSSPFPGMDPYLEAHWRDVHASLVIYTRDALQAVLSSALRARVEEEVLRQSLQGCTDCVRVIARTSNRARMQARAGGTAVAEPMLVDTVPETVTETFLQIIDRESGNRVVTVVEFLSPSNKTPGPNREQYVRKQLEICASDANLVEIDLNRFGIHTLAFPLQHVPSRLHTAYMASVRRATHRAKAEVYLLPLWERLRVINIPLRPGDADVPLD